MGWIFERDKVRYGTQQQRLIFSVTNEAEGTDGMSIDELSKLVTRDSMIGAGYALTPEKMNKPHDLGVKDKRPIPKSTSDDEKVVLIADSWTTRTLAITLAIGFLRAESRYNSVLS